LNAPSQTYLLGAPTAGPSGAWARAAANLATEAASVDGNATAFTTVPTGVEALAPQITEIQGSGALVGQATATLRAKATTVGDSASDTAFAVVDEQGILNAIGGGVVTSGLNLSDDSTTIGKSAQLFGQALLDSSATATTVQGDAAAGSASAKSIGITLDSQTVSIGATAEITAQADAIISSQANAVAGNAESFSQGGITAGFTEDLFGGGILSVGADAAVLASANTNVKAQSTTVNGSATLTSAFFGSPAAAQANAGESDTVKGLDITTLSIGGNGSIKASGTTQQEATAASIKNSPGNEGSIASASDGAQVYGAQLTDIEIGNTLSKSSFTGSATSKAQAQSVEGNSTSSAGSTKVRGAEAINVSVGRSITDTLAFDATLITTSNAQAINGLATSTAGNGAGGGTMALSDSDLKIGGNASAITADAVNQINSSASAVNPSTSPISANAGQVEAIADGIANAFFGNSINVGGSAPIKGTATTVINATANNTGSSLPLAPPIIGFTSLAKVTSDTSGVFLNNPGPAPADANIILIGNQGSVLGQSSTESRSIATSINPPTGSSGTSASSFIEQTGVELADYNSTIVIGGKGSIEGVSIFGGSQGSLSASSPVLAQANSVSDLVLASFIPGSMSMSAGILGSIDTAASPAGFSSLMAGPAGGSISGRSNSALEASAKNVGRSLSDTSTAEIGTSSDAGMVSLGITQVDMKAGLSGKDSITGASTLNSAISSESIQGNSSSVGNLISAGISNWSYATPSPPAIAGIASVSGAMSAISQMVNTSLAQSVHGSADSSLTTQSFGLSGYNVTMPNSGTLLAGATSQSNSKATSVHGSSSA
jgi:hypothetical protein